MFDHLGGRRVRRSYRLLAHGGTLVCYGRKPRQRGRGYYRDLCFKVNAHVCGTLEEIGDGGFTDWTRKLAASNKERLLISGIGVDRLAGFADR